jgi:MFS superfamily sulfate permease-like transporter
MDNRAMASPPSEGQAPTTQDASRGGSSDWSRTLKRDFLASIVVFLVALPLCMGIANACDLPPALGLITGIVGGIVVGLLAGCPLQVSGPAAGLVVTITEIVRNENLGIGMLGVIVFGAGVLQFIAGIFRLGQWFRAVSPAVIEGMLAGIGILIFAGQFHTMVDDRPRETGVQNILSIPEAIWKGLTPNIETTHDEAAFIGILTICIFVFWRILAPKKLQLLPAPLIAILVATIMTYTLGWPIARVQMPNDLTSEVSFPTWENLKRVVETPVWTAIFTVAFIASAETLLCATAVDGLHSGPRTKYDKELAGQGVGNILCGLLGALPMTGVIVRSAANVEAGAKTRLSAILHGVWLLLMVVFCAFLLRQVPVAALAAVLVYTGYRLMNFTVIKELWGWGWSEVAIYLCTVIGVVTTDLLKGVLLGIGLSVAKLLYRFSHLNLRLDVDPDEKHTVLHIEGAATFLRLPQLAAMLEKVPSATELHVHFENLSYIDHACLELLMTWEKQHEALGGSLVIDWDTLHAKFHEMPTGNGARPVEANPASPAESNGAKEADARLPHVGR